MVLVALESGRLSQPVTRPDADGPAFLTQFGTSLTPSHAFTIARPFAFSRKAVNDPKELLTGLLDSLLWRCGDA
jgi:hypothetical protein